MVEKKEKKTTKKQSTAKKIKITYNPIGFNQKSMLFFPLHKKNSKGHNVPLIKGIPMELKFMKGDVMEVTQKQYDELVAEGCV